MKIMKVVYQEECEASNWDGGNSQHYMGEESWSVGERFATDWVKGEVSTITENADGSVSIHVRVKPGHVVLGEKIYPHAVQRLYYGEG